MTIGCLRVLGTRGVPAAHGGFETFAERLSTHLVQRGWRVVVYCQEAGAGRIFYDTWQGVERVHIPVVQEGAKGTMIFDWKSTLHAAAHRDLCLTLGYNTAVFCALLRMKGIPNLINMDGIEWRRQKWSTLERMWLYGNERMGSWLGNHLIADHPEIESHLATRVSRSKITMIPYGSDRIERADGRVLALFGIKPRGYAIVIARPEPENSVLEIVSAFSRKARGVRLVVLGHYDRQVAYHDQVRNAASNEVEFPGAIYDKRVVNALRYFSLLYIHGHQVGGTNPSLVEALGAGSPVLAHDNRFNRWVAGSDSSYFADEAQCAHAFEALLGDANALARMAQASTERHASMFTWDKVLAQYEDLLSAWHSGT